MGDQALVSADFFNKLSCFLCTGELFKKTGQVCVRESKEVSFYCLAELLFGILLEFT